MKMRAALSSYARYSQGTARNSQKLSLLRGFQEKIYTQSYIALYSKSMASMEQPKFTGAEKKKTESAGSGKEEVELELVIEALMGVLDDDRDFM
jgi:hypothetical protein